VATGLLRFYIIFSFLSYIVIPMAPQVNIVHTEHFIVPTDAH